MTQITTPVLLLTYKRPQLARQVLDKIIASGVTKLYFASDGPKNDQDGILVKEVRQLINNIPNSIKLKKRFLKSNHGSRAAVVGAINWVFETEEQVIILEDDCLPEKSFFSYAQALLTKYHSDTRVFHISGHSLFSNLPSNPSYYFSNIPHVWGWATWKRAWRAYRANFEDLSLYLTTPHYQTLFKSETNIQQCINTFNQVQSGLLDAWDYQWTFTLWMEHGLAITPHNQLVKNIGFGPDATHTKSVNPRFSWQTKPLTKLTHPTTMLPNFENDEQVVAQLFPYHQPSLSYRLVTKLKQLNQ